MMLTGLLRKRSMHKCTSHALLSIVLKPLPPNVNHEKVYHKLVDSTLELITDYVGQLESVMDDVDISISEGVLNLKLGVRGTWVINKQTPNRQIWWSSPISGPRRYEYLPDEYSFLKRFAIKKNYALTADDANLISSWKYSRMMYKNSEDPADLLTHLTSEILDVTKFNLLEQTPEIILKEN